MSKGDGLIEMLEDLVVKAKAGKIDAFAAVFTVRDDPERHGGYALSIGDESNVMGLLGELRALEHRLCSGYVERR